MRPESLLRRAKTRTYRAMELKWFRRPDNCLYPCLLPNLFIINRLARVLADCELAWERSAPWCRPGWMQTPAAQPYCNRCLTVSCQSTFMPIRLSPRSRMGNRDLVVVTPPLWAAVCQFELMRLSLFARPLRRPAAQPPSCLPAKVRESPPSRRALSAGGLN